MGKNPQKILPGRYRVVPRTIILIIDEGRVLLQKATAGKKIFPGVYNGIGGHVERGEDALTAAQRELLEEAGVECVDLSMAGTTMIDVQDKQGILLFVFTGSKITGDLKDSVEGSLHWLEISRLMAYQTVDDIPELIERCMDFRVTGNPFFGRYLYSEDGERLAFYRVK